MSDEQRCEICGEGVLSYNPMAEMFDPDPQAPPWQESVICHAECGLAKGFELA